MKNTMLDTEGPAPIQAVHVEKHVKKPQTLIIIGIFSLI
jgi:hypothetical protein